MELKSKADVIRYGNKRYMMKPETLAEHVWYMMEIAIRLSEHIEFDLKDVMYRIMIHDIEESVTLDIPRDVKHSSQLYKDMTDDIAFRLLRREGIVTEGIIEDSKSAKSHDTIEGCIVHFCDVYQAYLKLSDEVYLLGNQSLKKELESECKPYLQSVIEEVITIYPECQYLTELI
jgi:5'-deoxynucleotidase YfbR-like HD superfamily hydrolase